MLALIESCLLGFAAVIDTVLLLIMLERINRPEVPVWLTYSLVGVWFFHVGDFLHNLLTDSTGGAALRLDDWCMTCMAFGLLLLPAAILHGGIRMMHTGTSARPPRDLRYAISYLPVLVLIPVTRAIFQSEERDFRIAVGAYTFSYAVWLVVANFGAAFCFSIARERLHRPQLIPFLSRFSAILVVMTVVVVAYLFVPTTSENEPLLRMLTAVSPVIPTLLFAWYAFRHRLMPLIFERTLVYGGCLIAVFWLHHLTIAPLTEALERKSQFDFVVLELVLLVALILAWRPLRDRVSESLRYLLSSSVNRVRDATRELSVQLAERTSDSPEALSQWLCESLRTTLAVRSTRIFITMGVVIDAASPTKSVDQGFCDLNPLRRKLAKAGFVTLDQLSGSDDDVYQIMQKTETSIAFRCAYRDVDGIILIGPRINSDRLSLEQRNTLALLFDQYAAVLFNQQREIIRRASERQAMQREKLSVLGLLAGSMAHEIRNPLSSMRTIATLLSEELPDSQSKKDVAMILTEIDRLSATTQRLLESARPADDHRSTAEPDVIIVRLLHILGHLARQFKVEVKTDLCASGVIIAATEATLSEIVFNLIKNAIEAVQNRPSPQVVVSSNCNLASIVIQIRDNGAGVAPELQNSLFQPFVTGKVDGTGLGLYIVAERVRELRGSIQCQTHIDGGTVFKVRLPVVSNMDQQTSPQE